MAFPSAYGAGAYTTGGRDGIIVHVTNLNNNGPGSFREALSMTVPRIIVFDVSGIINLTSLLYIDNDNSNVTIAGQTAPEGGITIDGARFYLNDVDNIIVRHIRFKGGINADYYPNSNDSLGNDSLSSVATMTNQIFDHCSFAFGADESASWYATGNGDNVNNVTIQRCLFAESVKGCIIGKQSGKTGPSPKISFISNLFYNSGYRFPNVTGDGGRIDVINNVVWNSSGRLIRGNGSFSLNHIGNYYHYNNFVLKNTSLNVFAYGTIPQIYTSDNILVAPNESTDTNDLTYSVSEMNSNNNLSWKFFLDGGGYQYGDQLPDNYFANNQHTLLGRAIPLLDGSQSLIDVSSNVGCSSRLNQDGSISDNLDEHDFLWLNNVISGSFTPKLETSEYVLPSIPSVQRPDNFYQSNPHIPEIWFQNNVPAGQDHNDIAPSGYTWIEEYLNGVDVDLSAVSAEDVEVLPSSAQIQIPETITLSTAFTPSDATNQSGVWASSDEAIATVDSNGVVTPVSEGIVIITFTSNDGGYTDTSEITVFPEALQASAGDDQQICEGETITLIATGGDYFLWNTGETTPEIQVSPVETTTYAVTVSDDFGQSDGATVMVTVNSMPTANAGEDQTICQGETITLTASGGDSYLWSTGETTASIEVSPEIETIYDVEVISNSCSSTDSVSVFVNPSPIIITSEDVVIVDGTSTTLIASGVDNYEWSTGETTDSITVNPTETTTYTVSSIGENGCIGYAEILVTVIPEVVADSGEDVTICNGETISLVATGGSTYSWSTGEDQAEISVSPEETTTYTVTVTDDYGYSDTDSITVFVNEAPNLVVNNQVYVMIGNSTTLVSNGGDTYLWSTGETTASIEVSPNETTTYTVTAISENGCETSADILVTVLDELMASAGDDVSICEGESTTLNASGGVSYAWDTGATTSQLTVSPLETTTYSVTVGDGYGNFDTDEVTVIVNTIPSAYAGEDETICEGELITLTASGGDSYIWSTGETTVSISVSPSTTTNYSVEVIQNNCSSVDDVIVFVNEAPNINVTNDLVIVNGESAVLTASGSDNYEWSTGETTNTINISPSVTTTYSVSSLGTNGCTATEEVTVTVIPEVVAEAGDDVSICEGESTILNASGGVSYAWNTGDNTQSLNVSPTNTTTYTITVTDEYGNSDSDSVTVTVNEIPTLSITDNVTIVEGETVSLQVQGANNYVWSTGETSASISVSPVQTTTYTVIGTSNSCSSEAQVTVIVEEPFMASAGTDERVCNNESYEVVLTAGQGDSYLWSTGATTQSIIVSPLSTTTYSVTVTQGQQEDTDDVTVYVDPSPEVVITNGESVDILSGDFITLSASGANTYQWNNGATQPNIAVSPNATTTYEVVGYIGDCFDEKQVTVNVYEPVVADAGADTNICLDEIVILTATGGDEYFWSTGETTQSIEVSPTETTEYTVTVFNAMSYDEDTVIVGVDANCGNSVVTPSEEQSETSLNIFPNPAKNSVNIKLSSSSLESDVHFYDLTGKLVKSVKILNENLNPVTIEQVDISMLQAGVYFVQLVDRDRDITKKLIID
ncbi:T9SS type A sorting domain-containing protein [Winogradskyella sp. SYSU M77433]|uniref:T9SS type A sorting domain-containing protein n=1 Tax=Winogradskyella sp. SYSU M77433 TaxID=3042722 RepID=UPI002480BA91|nr:T9SS type A sorting domain-containing protein [Winogradskyella sp. SYSU M77433]MDH7913950.1 Ig-like domain-containing protein [Winogradskyella sp. SYSU M77433]